MEENSNRKSGFLPWENDLEMMSKYKDRKVLILYQNISIIIIIYNYHLVKGLVTIATVVNTLTCN